MKKMVKLAIMIALVLTCRMTTYAQNNSGFVTYFSRITNPNNVPAVQYNATTQLATLTFLDTNLTNIAARYQFRQFQKAFPNSSQTSLQNMYLIEVNSVQYMQEMAAYNGDYMTDVDTALFSTYLLTINDPSYIPSSVNYVHWQAQVQFSQSAVQAIADDYTFRQFELAYPGSSDPQFQNVYLVEVNSGDFLDLLTTGFSGVFTASAKLEEHNYYLSITDPTYVPYASNQINNGGSFFASIQPMTLTFGNNVGSSITTLTSSSIFSDFHQSFPYSNLDHLQHLYSVKTTNPQVLEDLHNANSEVFAGYFEIGNTHPETNDPDDYGIYFPQSGYYYNDQRELDLIRAKDAWNLFPQGKVGNDSIKIAVNDGFVDDTHEDMQGKVTLLPHTGPLPSPDFAIHGTPVAGVIAAKTNNSKGLASIGYNLKIHSSQKISDTGMHELSLLYKMRLINASWSYGGPPAVPPACFYPQDENNMAYWYHKLQDMYWEAYENGTTCVFSAGNGSTVPDNYCTDSGYKIPASYEPNISVTSVGYYPLSPSLDLAKAMATGSYKDCHYPSNDPTTGVHNHNNRVDICAPGYSVKCLIHKPAPNANKYKFETGTSVAAPFVTGTLGLMLSMKSCLSPYQLEYLLKSSSNDSIYNATVYPNNARFAAKKQLGEGRLDAYEAVKAAKNFDCNDPAFQTMYIEGFTLNHRCPPGFSTNGTVPKVKAIVRGARTPLTFRWVPLWMDGNTCEMLQTEADSNEVVSCSPPPGGSRVIYYLVIAREQKTSTNPYPKIATKRLKIVMHQANEQQQSYDLGMRDSWMDMLKQENDQDKIDKRDWDIWHSPDIWNRISADSVFEHEDPDYSSTNPNHLYFRIKNYGCQTSPATGKLNLYWTLSSTGEIWKDAWTKAPKGEEITLGHPVSIPALAPGQEFVGQVNWMPPNPADWDPSGNKKVDACVLARIEVPNTDNFNIGMYGQEGQSIKYNVKANNNIVTRNLFIVDRFQNRISTRLLHIGNSHGTAMTYSLQVLNNKDIWRNMAGDLSKFMTVTLYLGSLYDRWVAGGSQGEGFVANSNDKTVTYDPATPLRLDNIFLDAEEEFPIDVQFTLRSGITLDYPIENQTVHIRQIIRTLERGIPDMGTAFYKEEVHGNVSYAIRIPVDSVNGLPGSQRINAASQQDALTDLRTEDDYSFYPNPVNNLLTIATPINNVIADIAITDVTGRIIIKENQAHFANNEHQINTSAMLPGIYFIKLIDANGKIYSTRFIKTN